jgi:hypothetical protein
MQSLKTYISEGLLAGQDATLDRGQDDLDAVAIQDIEKKLLDTNKYYIHNPNKKLEDYRIRKTRGKWVVDINGDLTVYGMDEAITDGSFSFGFVLGQYCVSCGYDNTTLKSLQYGPKEVGGNMLIFWGEKLKDLQYCPERIHGDFEINASGIETLKYFPKFVGRNIRIADCMNLKDLKKIGKSRVMGKLRIGNNFAKATEEVANNMFDKWGIGSMQARISLFDYNINDWRQMN